MQNVCFRMMRLIYDMTLSTSYDKTEYANVYNREFLKMFKYYQCKYVTGYGIISFTANSDHSCGSSILLSGI